MAIYEYRNSQTNEIVSAVHFDPWVSRADLVTLFGANTTVLCRWNADETRECHKFYAGHPRENRLKLAVWRDEWIVMRDDCHLETFTDDEFCQKFVRV